MPIADRRGIDDLIQAWKEAENGHDRDAAARAFWTRAATVAAREITSKNVRLATRDGLYELIGDWHTGQIPSSREQSERRSLAKQFLDSLQEQGIEILKEVAVEALIELFLPGTHLVLPPTGFVSSIFTACDLLAIFPPA